MTKSARTATRSELDLRVFFELIERAHALYSVEERGCLDLGRQVVLDMVRLLHERSTTLARLRRLFGIRTTEKLSAVFPSAGKPANDEASPTSADGQDDPGEDERDDDSDPRDRADHGNTSGDDRDPSPHRDVPEGRGGAE
ncbi:MAG: hypothetical protein ACREU5_11270, partial [Burkholderiales bacterium]